MAIEKIKILGAVLELPARQHRQSSPYTWKMGQIGQIGSSKTATSILIFSILLGVDYSFYVKSIATYASHFWGIIIQS